MVSWNDFAASEPEFARRVQDRFERQKHMTLATLRRDGSPRISGTEVEFVEGELRLGMMLGSMKLLDVLRDPRLALHSPSIDPPENDPGAWVGEAKVSGHAVEVPPSGDANDGRGFRVVIDEVVMTTVDADQELLVVESWSPATGLRVRKRS